MKYSVLFFGLIVYSVIPMFAQERVVKIDFESGSFKNNPNIPFNQPFLIQGEAGNDIEFVKVNIYYANKNFVLHSFVWNRIEPNKSESFNIVVPAILKSNTKYDFEIITYKFLSNIQKEEILKNMEYRIQFLLINNIYFDGKNVIVNKPKDVFNKIDQLINESFKHFESKNFIPIQAPSDLVLEELRKQSDFKLSRFFRRSSRMERDDIANKFASDKVEHLVALISSELAPFLNSQLVQHHRQANISSVETDKEPFTLPVNIGMYAWGKTLIINNESANNIDFTPGAGLTIPFKNKSKLASKTRMLDSFGFSAGVLFKPVVDNNGNEFVTPGVTLPVYTGFGLRVFKVARFNAGVLVLGEKGNQGFDNLLVIPTAGLALELNLWMGIKKIIEFVLTGIAVFALNACKVQAPGYLSLYVDNLISVNDTAAYPGEALLNMADTIAVTKAESQGDLLPAKETVKVSSDSIYQQDVKELLTAITDTIKLLRNQVNELKKHPDLKVDTVYDTKEIITQFKGDSIQTDYETTLLLQSKNDTILSLRKRVDELQRFGIIKADTVYVIRDTTVSPLAENRQPDQLTLQLLRSKDEQINALQNQLSFLQNAAARTPQPTHITKEPAQVQPMASQQPDQSTLQLLQAQNDTIQLLRTQLRNLQLQPHKRDTVSIGKEAKELRSIKEIGEQRESDFQSLQDTIRLLKTRLLSLELQTLPGKYTTVAARQDEKDEPLTAITDTTLLVAYYELGVIKPIQEEGILQQIKKLCNYKNVTKITLSGYTDSSGSETINKEITNRRLNYLSEMIIPWIAKEKIFFQNFGDVFASDIVVKDERRIEIRIHPK